MAVTPATTGARAPINRPADVIGIPGSSTILFQIQSLRRDILLPFFCKARLCELRAASRHRRASGEEQSFSGWAHMSLKRPFSCTQTTAERKFAGT